MNATASTAIQVLEEMQRLMELKGENPFKIRAFEKAVGVLSALPSQDDLLKRAQTGTLTELPGIGKGISEVLVEFLVHHRTPALDDLRKSIPPELLELTRVPGLGPKKAQVLIDELEIKSLRELEYACRENRLLKLKGFGEKLQSKILEGIRFLDSNAGQQRLADVFEFAERAIVDWHRLLNAGRKPAGIADFRLQETGALRRRLEVLSELSFLAELSSDPEAAKEQKACLEKASLDAASAGAPLPVRFYYATAEDFGFVLAKTTATEAHWKALGSPTLSKGHAAEEADVYRQLKIELMPPETRETGEEVRLAREHQFPDLLPWDGVRGVFHNHTTRSDGAASLEEMVIAARELGYDYLGISDHSQSAFYAQGLKVPDLLDQEKEVRKVQEKYPEFRIFWGIESDILADGSLDYEEKVLRKFDFVVASVHSRFQMDEETMTQRILQAIRHPCTRFLGHATGRLLLGRPGYPVDMERVIAEAAKYDVAIEINANPARLDIDWRWGPSLRKSKTLVSVNPDAHEVSGLADTRYGICVARKALLPQGLVVNARSTADVEKWLRRS